MSKQVISSSVYCEKGEKVPQICRKTERKLSFELKLETIEEEKSGFLPSIVSINKCRRFF